MPTVDSTVVFLTSAAREVFAVEKASGRIVWRAVTKQLPGQIRGLGSVLAGDVLAVSDGEVYAFDRQTGARRWTFAPPEGVPGYSLLASDGETIYAGSPSRALVFAIKASDGSSRWTSRIDSDTGAIAWDPVVDGDAVYVPVQRPTNPRTGGLVVLNKADGTVRWRVEFTASAPGRGAGGHGPVALTESLVVLPANDGTIWALSRQTGSVVWTAPRPTEVGGLDDFRHVVRVGTRIVAGSSASVLTAHVAATGAVAWQLRPDGMGSLISPLATDGSSVFVNGSGILAHASEHGAVVWRAGESGGTFCFLFGAAADAQNVYASGCGASYAVKK